MTESGLRSIEKKLDKLYDLTMENKRDVAVIKNSFENHSEKLENITLNCSRNTGKFSIALDKHNERIDQLENTIERNKGVIIGVSALVSFLVTAVTVTKALGLW